METIFVKNKKPMWKKKLFIVTPTLGIVRFEWVHARYNQIIPMNWEASGFEVNYLVMGYTVDDAYNMAVKEMIDRELEWMLCIEDDVIIPPNCFSKMSEYMQEGKIPIISGLYYLKGSPTQPIIFRGRGTGAYTKFKIGDKVWVDGLPMGCLLIHGSILKWFWDNSPEYRANDGKILRRVFESPQRLFLDPESQEIGFAGGTQDLPFFWRIIDEKVLEQTGWKQVAKRKYPFLCDTSIFCRHIDRNTGKQYP